MTQPGPGDSLRADMERLADIGDEILSGVPIERFDLTPNERIFVLGYTRQAVEGYLGAVEDEGPK